ncbi:MAG: MopE-related protein [Myxococcaceae bacterium]
MRVRTGQSWVLALAVFVLGFGVLSGCGRSGPLADRPRACVFDRDCPDGLRCVNGQCAEVKDAGGRQGWKQFGEPCEHTDECLSGYCLGGPRGAFCSMPCDGECPSGFDCKVVPDPSAADTIDAGVVAQVALCALPQPLLCQPCAQDSECGASGGDHCLPSESGLHGFCGQDCTFEACPDGYACTDSPRGRQCSPIGQTCDCTPDTDGRLRGCATTNDVGTCYGSQVCSSDSGWGTCSAREAVVEDCNGVDDDCDGRVDEDLPAKTCTRTGAVGTCTGPATCQGAAGWRCDAPTPASESCNYVDDDCDGTVDESFADSAGRYVQPQHCGGCGNDCAVLIANSTATTCELEAAGAPTCRVQQCATGFFPSPDGRQCLKLADSLCRACVEDSDCAGPGSRCVSLNGERFCARDCGPGSAFPACPGGYVCSATASGQQCVPANGTCQCTAQQLGNTRSCNVQTCTGYQTCANTASGPAWSGCDVDSFNPEQCDGVDNNCNGQVDEGFRNTATGKYQATEHCGFCNNDCSKYWSPTLQHTTGMCDTVPTVPVCKMGACTTEVVGGTTYEWRDVNGDTEDGCECRRVQGNTTLDQPEELAPFVDENCDGIDGVIGNALFVWAGASPGGSGSLSTPFRTISDALAAFPTSGKEYVLVAEGTYSENLSVTDGMRLYGGYARDFKKRDPVLHTSTVQGVVPAGGSAAQAAVHIRNAGQATARTVVAGFSIRGVDQVAAPPDNADGAASVAMLLENAGANARVVNNEIVAGRGGRGGRGTSGTQGFGRQSSTELNGRNGQNGGAQRAPCPAGFGRPGGVGGVNSSCSAASAIPGGSIVCPSFNWNSNPISGAQTQYPAGSGLNGQGGRDWSFDQMSFSNGLDSCSHVTESGFPSNIQSHDGQDGEAGADGNVGTGGASAPARARFGTIVNGRWVPSPLKGTSGGGGGFGDAGGGGGAGGGTAHLSGGPCPLFEFGATGGGGGAGGCGGVGGLAGSAGGASIGVLVVLPNSPGRPQMPAIEGNRIQRNLGGDGGNGGFGGAGGLGGAGGFGGGNTTWSGSTAGKGGEGGNGGAGGGGGGGAGGPSYGILAYRGSGTDWPNQNVFLTSGSSATGGKGGTGGSSSGSGSGGNGADGASANLMTLVPCSAGCPASTVCDPNGVCVPQ